MAKLKIYLDTNTVMDFFLNQAKTMKDKRKAEIPRKLKFFLRNSDKLEFVVSFLTKTEIMRELISARNIPQSMVEKVWGDFIKLLNCHYVEGFYFDEKLVDIAGRMRLRLKTLINFQHLFIAMNEGAYFVTGDKDIIEKSRQYEVYDKMLSYIELRKLVESSG